MGQEAHTAQERRQPADTVVSSLQIVCAWCQQHIVWHRMQTPMLFPISYSICARCYANVARELAPLTVDTATAATLS
jgi:hypothetical protein